MSIALAGTLTLLLSSVAPAHAQTIASSTIEDLLQRRAAAVQQGDKAAFDKTMDGAPAAFMARQRTWFERIRSLPLQTYALSLSDQEYGNLAPTANSDVRIYQVDERIGLRGYDQRPSVETVYLTFKQVSGTWRVIADDDLEPIGLLSMRNIWDFGPIQIEQDDGIMVIFHPAQRDAVPTILAQSKAARARVHRDWPFPWNDPVVIMVPSTVGELERVLQTTFDLTQFVAFAASSLDRTDGYKLTGNRIFLHWPNFRKYQPGFQTSVLSHEFLHLATRSIAGPFTTSIFDEGVAQHYGEGGGESVQLRRRVRAGTLPRTLVPDWFFLAGPRDDIFLSYEEGASFIRYLTKRFGKNAGADAYRALGTIDPDSAGTWRYHLDRVSQQLFKSTFADLERGWHQSVIKEYS